MDSSTLVLTLRVLVSLAVVLGLVWWFARRNRSGAHARVRPASVSVVGRQTLGRHSAVAVVEVEGRRLLLGLTDQQVSLLAELTAEPTPARRGVERTEIDPAELARMVGMDEPSLVDELAALEAEDAAVPAPRPAAPRAAAPAPARPAPAAPAPAAPVPAAPARATRPERASRRPAARTPAVPMQRRPLEGSILDASTWRQAVVAVQERTIRR